MAEKLGNLNIAPDIKRLHENISKQIGISPYKFEQIYIVILVFIYSGSKDILQTYKMGELQESQDVFLSRSSFIGTGPRN